MISECAREQTANGDMVTSLNPSGGIVKHKVESGGFGHWLPARPEWPKNVDVYCIRFQLVDVNGVVA